MASAVSEDRSDVSLFDVAAQWAYDRSNVGELKIGKKAAVRIVNVLLPRYVPDLKKSDYETMQNCNKWLSSLTDHGTIWDLKMEHVTKENSRAHTANQPRLF